MIKPLRFVFSLVLIVSVFGAALAMTPPPTPTASPTLASPERNTRATLQAQPTFVLTPTASPIPDILTSGVYEAVMTHGPSVYHLTAESGQFFIMEVTSADFDLVIDVYNSAGRLIAQDDDSGGLNRPMLLFVAPANDTYRVVVRQYADGIGGHYVLRVTSDIEVLTHNVQVMREFRDAQAFVYAFDATAGDIFMLMTFSGGQVDTTLRVLSPSGAEIAYVDDYVTLDPVLPMFHIVETGRHYVIHSPYSQSVTGRVMLRLDKIVVEWLGAEPVEATGIAPIVRIYALDATAGGLYMLDFSADTAISGLLDVIDSRVQSLASGEFLTTERGSLAFRAAITAPVQILLTMQVLGAEDNEVTITLQASEVEE